MSLTIYLICFVVLAIVVLIIISIASPDNWGRASNGCNQNCCVSCSNSCGNSNSGYGLISSKGNKSKFLDDPNFRVFNVKGEEASKEFIRQNRKQVLEHLKMSHDPYTLDPQHEIWKSYIQAKKNAENELFIDQPIYVIKSKWFKPFVAQKKKFHHKA